MGNENQPKTRDEWLQLVKDQENSNLSQNEFCKQHNLIPCRFSYYRQVYRQQVTRRDKQENTFSTVVLKSNLEKNCEVEVINKISFMNINQHVTAITHKVF